MMSKNLSKTLRKWTRWAVLVAVAGFILYQVAGPMIPIQRTTRWCCPVTGSTKVETVWLWFFDSKTVTPTALERWLRQREPDFQPPWEFTSRQTRYLHGRSCGTRGTPAVFNLRPLLDDLVATSSDETLAQLVETLRNGSPEEREQAVQNTTRSILEGDVSQTSPPRSHEDTKTRR